MSLSFYTGLVENWFALIDSKSNINMNQLCEDTEMGIVYLEHLKKGNLISQIKLSSCEVLKKFNQHSVGESELLAKLVATHSSQKMYSVLHRFFQIIAESYGTPEVLSEDFDCSSSFSPDLLSIMNIDAAALNYMKQTPPMNKEADSFDEGSSIFSRFSSSLYAGKHLIKTYLQSQPSRVKKPLKVIEIRKKEREDIKKVVEQWSLLAQKRLIQVKLLYPSFLEWIRSSSHYNHSVFADSWAICDSIYYALRKNGYNDKQKVYACCLDEMDLDEKIESIAVVIPFNRRPKKSSYLYLSLLASHPKNINSPVNKSESQVSGAALKLINHLKEVVCPQLNMEQIRLMTTNCAEGFYKKLGFQSCSRGLKLKLT